MIVKIINPKPYTWYANKRGWQYEVEETKMRSGEPAYLVLETKDDFWQLCISAEDAEVVEA